MSAGRWRSVCPFRLRQAHDSSALALFVWKYFEEDIRATLLEIQDGRAGDKSTPKSKTRTRKQEGK
jgi:hypothetical protein